MKLLIAKFKDSHRSNWKLLNPPRVGELLELPENMEELNLITVGDSIRIRELKRGGQLVVLSKKTFNCGESWLYADPRVIVGDIFPERHCVVGGGKPIFFPISNDYAPGDGTLRPSPHGGYRCEFYREDLFSFYRIDEVKSSKYFHHCPNWKACLETLEKEL